MNTLYNEFNRKLSHFFLITWFVILCIISRNLSFSHLFNDGVRTFLFIILSKITYAFIYLLPAITITKVLHWLINRKTITKIKQNVISSIAIISCGFSTLFIFINIELFIRYGFFVNGFVINLILTPKGLESLGCSNSTVIMFMIIGLSFFLLQLGIFMSISYLANKKFKFMLSKHFYSILLCIFIIFSISERAIFAVSHLQGYTSILKLSNDLPFYKPATITKLARFLGFNVHHDIKIGKTSGLLNYPLVPLNIEVPKKPLNIIWLVAESLRADALTKEVMPATYAFAQESNNFINHYSGGNGTRIAIFSMFTGLCGTYWPEFLGEQKSPILFDILLKQNYQIECFTSASFSYPEFDKTIFSLIPSEKLHEVHGEEHGWVKDRINVTNIIDVIKKRDLNKPFMSFMFFESSHARYYFPEECIIKKPYIKDLNYATMSLEKDMPMVKNSYLNSAHHLDTQISRIIDFLKNEKLLDSTIVIITGDHGEEFMEFGKWGHNSNFTDPQTKTPLILYIPKKPSKRWTKLTSHMDLPATILPLLGVKNPPGDYSLGYNLTGEDTRTFLYMADWDRITYMDSEFKISLPIKTSGMWNSSITTKDDKPLPDKELNNIIEKKQSAFIKLLDDMKKFRKSK